MLLSRLPFPESYRGKILLIAFTCTHVPLLALVAYLFSFSRIDLAEALPVLVVVLVATVLGSAAALYALHTLLAPVSLASDALRAYREHGEFPDLPTGTDDGADRLLGEVQGTIHHLDDLVRSLQDLSTRDALTGAYNRRGCEERLAEDMARVERSESTLTLVVLDADRLKEVNDLYGHEAGDACLRYIADTIRRNIRESDWLARWGGDEFVVALWDATDPDSPEKIMGRIASELRETTVQLPWGEETSITLSAGVSRYEGGEGPWGMFARADAALYRAKREGRDRIAYGE